MAVEWKHKRYYRIRGGDSSLREYSNTNDFVTAIGFASAYTTNSPTITYELADSNKTLVQTIEHSSASNQTQWKDAVDALYSDGKSTWPWSGDAEDSTGNHVEHWKTEWLDGNGDVDNTTHMDYNPAK